MLMVLFALLAMPMVQQAQPAPVLPSPVQTAPQTTVSAGAVQAETPQQAAERRRLARLEVICSRQAPTGSRLDRTKCEQRDRAELQARSSRMEADNYVNSTGIVKGAD
jgi:hypothetical protein